MDHGDGHHDAGDAGSADRDATGSHPAVSGEWGRVQDVPDPSCENPEYGRYAQTSHARAARKRRIKRNAGGYGPCKPKPPPVDRWHISTDHSSDSDDLPF